MKMKKIFTILLILFFFQSCEKEVEKYERLIVGQWTTYSDFASDLFTGSGGGNGKEVIYTFTENTYAVYYESENSSKGELLT